MNINEAELDFWRKGTEREDRATKENEKDHLGRKECEATFNGEGINIYLSLGLGQEVLPRVHAVLRCFERVIMR
jgi:hypothetical protein